MKVLTIPKEGILNKRDMYRPDFITQHKPLSPDYAVLHKLLECPTCFFCDAARLFRGPCCNNVNRPHFALSGHNAITDGKCPSYQKRESRLQEQIERTFMEVYEYGNKI